MAGNQWNRRIRFWNNHRLQQPQVSSFDAELRQASIEHVRDFDGGRTAVGTERLDRVGVSICLTGMPFALAVR
jgi:hypothetical protein